MRAIVAPGKASGTIIAPPSKSMAHRYLIGAALSKEKCILSGVDYSEDIRASIDCLKAMGAEITTDTDTVTVNSHFIDNGNMIGGDLFVDADTVEDFNPVVGSLTVQVVDHDVRFFGGE